MGCDIHMMAEVLVNGVWMAASNDSIYRGRNYDLFGILADVRNGIGFAGRTTGAGFQPIAQPRGTPSDVSPQGTVFVNTYGSDGHSHSYFTLAELLAYDWTQITTYVDGKSVTYAQAAGDFLDKTVPALILLGKPADVRIIFFFDN